MSVPLIAVVGDPELYAAIIASPDLSSLDDHLSSVDDLLELHGDDLDALDAIVVGTYAWRSAATPVGLRFLCDCPVLVLGGDTVSLDVIREVVGIDPHKTTIDAPVFMDAVQTLAPGDTIPQPAPLYVADLDGVTAPSVQPPVTYPPPAAPDDGLSLITEATPAQSPAALDTGVPTSPLVEVAAWADVGDFFLTPDEPQPGISTEPPLASIPRFPVRKGECLTIASWSSKGGVGKTAMAVNLAGAITRMTDLSVCVVDLDVEDPNVGSRLNIFKPTATEVLDLPTLSPDTIRPMLAHDELTNVYAVLGPRQGTGEAAMYRLSPGNYDRIHRVLVQMFDVVILDCPLGLNAPLAGDFALQRAGILLAVTDTERSTVKGLGKALREVFEERHYPREAVGLIINQQVGKKNAMPRGEMLDMLQRLPVLAEIMDDRDAFVGSANKGSLLVNRFGPEGDTMRQKFAEILHHLLPNVEITEDRPAATSKAGKKLRSLFRSAQ